MTDVNDPVRRLLKRIADGRYLDELLAVRSVAPDVAKLWLSLPEQLQQARDAMRWRKASRELPDGIYVTVIVGHGGVDVAMVADGRLYGRLADDSDASISLDDVSKHARFLGPLPEVPR